MKMQKSSKNVHEDNRGSGLIMALITMAFIGILASILMVASFSGLKMRNVDHQNKGSFYTAETVVDEINLGLQEVVSESLLVAYEDVMQNYAMYDNAAKRNNMFYEKYYDEVQNRLQFSPKDDAHGSVTKLISYLSDDAKGDGNGTREGFQTHGAIVESLTGNPEDRATKYDIEVEDGKGLLLKNIEVTYVDDRNTVAIIDTDIRVQMPKFNFSDGSSFPELNQVALLTNGAIDVKTTQNNGSIDIAGNVCSDSITIKKGVNTKPTVSFKPAPSSDPDDDSERLGMVVVNGDLEVDKGKINTTSMELWASNILLDSASASLDGSTFVSGDLILAGESSNAKLAGSYVGYGASMDASNSSAILINGKESGLDLSGLKSLHIGGRAYVGTKNNEFANNLTPENKELFKDKKNEDDIFMGQSVAVKSNQLVYLVPPEVLGCEKGADGSINGSIFNRNPLPADKYEMIISNPQKYALVDRDKPIAQLGGKTLRDYTGDKAPQIVFKHTNGGSLVYCYMNFIDENKGNDYFRDYYNINRASVDKYTKLYVNELKMGSTDSFVQLNLAGNALAYSSDPAVGGSIRLATGSQVSRSNMEAELKNTKIALSKKLLPGIGDLKPSELDGNLFDNIINEIELNNVLDGTGGVFVYENADAEKVIATNKDYTIRDNDIRMVISTKSVTVDCDFKGAIFAKEGINIQDSEHNKNVSITALNFDEFVSVLSANNDVDYAIALFNDGSKQFGGSSFNGNNEKVDLVDLITYEGWNKK